MRAQFASGIITAQRRVKLVQELLQVSSGGTDTEGPAGRAAGWRAPCPWHGSRGPVGCRAPRCQRLSSPLPQAQEWAKEQRKAKARKSLLKVSNCSGMGLVCVCRHSSTAVGRVVREVPSCGSAAPALWVLAALMEEGGGDGGMELESDEAPWECRCPDGHSSFPFP
mgnify:CR=1 FL=1